MLLHVPLLIAAVVAAPPKEAGPRTNGVIMLDGVETNVHWDDGDTFFAPSSGVKARLVGYNTLESYGAVHRFGPGEVALFQIASDATALATSRSWTCTTESGEGGYGRKSVDCPGLRGALLEAGLAHAFSVQGPAPKDDLDAQARGIEAKAGMWAQGAPKGLVTSVHSLDEKPGATSTYNRVLNVETGEASKRPHANTHKPCEWVCAEGSCLLYVPYKQRYGDGKAQCLQ